MNIVLDISKFTLGNTFFLDAKRNIIMEGSFTKIIYSNQFVTLNGIYLYLPIEIQSIDKINNKNIMKFHPSSQLNTPLIQELSRMEYRIIEYYKQLHNITKKTTCLLTRQLYMGNLKIYKDYADYGMKNLKDPAPHYIVKISGIWETEEEIGTTYKIIECYTPRMV
jgi:hypothetical protein